ncbi:hypothetical protein PDJAM_G00143590 [Pangasius djambal]|uniref:Uncharacterized protein n=1 Tax=Pangasius djambal TaxID=1691987 RepID=A0ACC5ZFE8_9TELE|nr:hypothetical protein [Pangasius djambal]
MGDGCWGKIRQRQRERERAHTHTHTHTHTHRDTQTDTRPGWRSTWIKKRSRKDEICWWIESQGSCNGAVMEVC